MKNSSTVSIFLNTIFVWIMIIATLVVAIIALIKAMHTTKNGCSGDNNVIVQAVKEEASSSDSSGCTAPSTCVLPPPYEGATSDYFSSAGSPCSPLSPSDTFTYHFNNQAYQDDITISATYSDTLGFTFQTSTIGSIPRTFTTTATWNAFPTDGTQLPFDDELPLGGMIYYRQIPGDDGGTNGEWFFDVWYDPYFRSCLCPEPDDLYGSDPPYVAKGTISKCECKCFTDASYHSFYITFDGTYFSIFSLVGVSSFDTDKTIVILHNKFIITINKNDATASYEITPN